MKVSVVISAGGSFYGNYASDNVCDIFEGFQVLLSVTVMLVDLSVTIMQVIAGASFCSKYVGENFYRNYADGSLCYNYAGGIFCSALCT